VRAGHRRLRTDGSAQVADVAGRPAAELVAAHAIDIRFVERTPEVAQVPQRRDGLGHIAREEWDGVGCQKRAALLEPDRVREVVQSDEWRKSPLAQALEHLAVACERRIIPCAWSRLDPAPFQRETQGVQPHLRGEVEVALGCPAGRAARGVPPVAGPSARLAGLDVPGLLPGVPLIVGVTALVLVRRGSDAPQEAVGKRQRADRGRRLRSLLRLLLCHHPPPVSRPNRTCPLTCQYSRCAAPSHQHFSTGEQPGHPMAIAR